MIEMDRARQEIEMGKVTQLESRVTQRMFRVV